MNYFTKFLHATVFFCFIAIYGFSQDIMILKSGEEIQSKVEEIGTDIVKYHKFENLTGPMYTIEKSKIFMIKYQNGTKELFDTQPIQPVQQATTPQTTAPEQTGVPTAQNLKYKKGGLIVINDKTLRDDECRKILATNPEALQKYHSGQKLMNMGNTISYATLIPGLGIAILVSQDVLTVFPYSVYAVAILTTGLVSSIIITVNGRHKVRDAVNTYNKANK